MIISEVAQSQEDKTHVISLICRLCLVSACMYLDKWVSIQLKLRKLVRGWTGWAEGHTQYMNKVETRLFKDWFSSSPSQHRLSPFFLILAILPGVRFYPIVFLNDVPDDARCWLSFFTKHLLNCCLFWSFVFVFYNAFIFCKMSILIECPP